MIGFFTVFTCLMGALHLYIWRRLVRDTRLRGSSRRWATAFVVGLGLSLPMAMFSSRNVPNDMGFWPALIGYTWLGLMFYVVVFLILFDVVRVAQWLRDKVRPARGEAGAPQSTLADPSRREFLTRAGAITTLASSGVIGAYGLYSGLGDIETPEVQVRLPRLPPALDGFRIAQLTDVHIGDLLGQRFLRGVVEQTNRQRPDLIAITGDLVDGSVAELGPAVAELAKLKARHGVYFVTGNHEYYSGAEPWIAFLRSLGIVVLMNERLSIGERAASFDLIGVPDHHAHPVRADMQAAARGRDGSRELIVLAHQPVQVRDAIAIGAGLQISGHTHGGQMFPFGALTALVQPHLAGLERAGGDTQIYTSRGTGFWGPPMRVLAPAEITTLVLTR